MARKKSFKQNVIYYVALFRKLLDTNNRDDVSVFERTISLKREKSYSDEERRTLLAKLEAYNRLYSTGFWIDFCFNKNNTSEWRIKEITNKKQKKGEYQLKLSI